VPVIAARLLEEVLTDRGLKPRAFTQAALALVAAVGLVAAMAARQQQRLPGRS
jgi:hypothetical protein